MHVYEAIVNGLESIGVDTAFGGNGENIASLTVALNPFPDPGRLMGVLGPVEFSTDVKCCDDSGGRFMLVAERAMPWSAWRLLSWHARSARCVVGVCGG